MPSVIIPVPAFPTVPMLPGVPQLLRSPTVPPPVAPTLGVQAQSALYAAKMASFKWGIYNASNVAVIVPDSFLQFSFEADWETSNFPIQGGKLADYNKVTLPYDTVVRMSKGGSLADRTAFINQIKAIAGDTNLYTIVTPEQSYRNINVTKVSVMRRGKEGAYFLCEVDVYFRHVPQTTAQYATVAPTSNSDTTNANNPAAQPTTNQGNVQPQTPSSSVVAQYNAAALVGR